MAGADQAPGVWGEVRAGVSDVSMPDDPMLLAGFWRRRRDDRMLVEAFWMLFAMLMGACLQLICVEILIDVKPINALGGVAALLCLTGFVLDLVNWWRWRRARMTANDLYVDAFVRSLMARGEE